MYFDFRLGLRISARSYVWKNIIISSFYLEMACFTQKKKFGENWTSSVDWCVAELSVTHQNKGLDKV